MKYSVCYIKNDCKKFVNDCVVMVSMFQQIRERKLRSFFKQTVIRSTILYAYVLGPIVFFIESKMFR